MRQALLLYNSLTKKKEQFDPIDPPYVGMYLCGPTVYGETHLGHARSAITFDILFRYLMHIGYRVRYIRNITDVGHLENDADEGDDKIGKQARLKQLNPMQIAQQCINAYHRDMDALNVHRPSIEPTATGHIIEQIELIKKILKQGFAYEVNGSIYFDVNKYNQSYHYGILSGRKIEDLLAGTRALAHQNEKKNLVDFALWKKATPTHIMRWPSPWGEGFPGWHLECSAMSKKYLGEQFDIHGGGLDLLFPHHECEIAQSQAAHQTNPARYWIHNNLITIKGKKMGKSLGNTLSLSDLFTGQNKALDQAYEPMVLRFFILQAHYRSTLDFSLEALQASKQAYWKLVNGSIYLRKVLISNEFNTLKEEGRNVDLINQIQSHAEDCYRYMNDDLNTAQTIAVLFKFLKIINLLRNENISPTALGKGALQNLANTFHLFFESILGLKYFSNSTTETLIEELVQIYQKAKQAKDYEKVDHIRAVLKKQGVLLQDRATCVDWCYER